MAGFIYVVCEGQSESVFIKHVLSPYIQEQTAYQWFLIPYVVVTSTDRKRGIVNRGGLLEYQKARNDILRCLKNGKYVTTMFDYFRLPHSFPGYDASMNLAGDYDRVLSLEHGLDEDIRNPMFFSHLSLHEFETLFFSDLDALKTVYIGSEAVIDKLKDDVKGMKPEEINNGDETAPSKRLIRYFGYEKGNEVMVPLKSIGIEKIRSECPHFSEWVDKIEKICRSS